MTEKLTQRDWMLISAYIDSRLSPSQIEHIEGRLKADSQFKAAIDEIAYTRRLLRSLPQKHAPRNFTLARETTKAPLKALWLQPALSYASVLSALLLVVVFAGSYLLGGTSLATPKTSAPMVEMLPADYAVTEDQAPKIIQWNPMLGMGGGGGAPDIQEIYTGGDGIGGAGGPGFVTEEISTAEPVAAPDEMVLAQEPPADASPSEGERTLEPIATDEPAADLPMVAAAPNEQPTQEPLTMEPPALKATEEPMMEPTPLAEPDASQPKGDLSTLILGVPDTTQQGEVISVGQSTPPSLPIQTRLPYLLLAILGAITLLSGAAALVLRRR